MEIVKIEITQSTIFHKMLEKGFMMTAAKVKLKGLRF